MDISPNLSGGQVHEGEILHMTYYGVIEHYIVRGFGERRLRSLTLIQT